MISSRSTGQSRTAVCLIFLYGLINLLFPRLKHCSVFLGSLCFFSIFYYSSRGSYILLFCLVVFLNYITFKNKAEWSGHMKIQTIFGMCIFALTSILIYSVREFTELTSLNSNYQFVRSLADTEMSGGRIPFWRVAISHLNDNFTYFGNGIQFDRFLFKDTYSATVSNGILYSLLCSGILGFSFLFTSVCSIIPKAFRTLYIYRSQQLNAVDFRNNLPQVAGATLIVLFTIRILFENSFSIFGIDFLLVCLSFHLLGKRGPAVAIKKIPSYKELIPRKKK